MDIYFVLPWLVLIVPMGLWFIYSGVQVYQRAKTKPLAKSDKYSIYGNDYLYGISTVVLGILVIFAPLLAVLHWP